LSKLFEVVVLGSGAALPTSNRAPSAQYIVCNNRHLLIDCGEGTQSQMRKYGVHFQKIAHIFISHLHGDHYFGLIGLLSTMSLLGRNQGLTIYGPVSLENILKVQFEAAFSPLNFQLNFIPLTANQKEVIFEDNLLRVSAFPLKHRIPTFGFLIEEKGSELKLNLPALKEAGIKKEYFRLLKQGNSIELLDGTLLNFADYTISASPPLSYAYCSDTAPFKNIYSFINGTTFLYHEATFSNRHKERAKNTAHSTAEQAATVALNLGVKQLFLGHFSSRYANCEEHLSEASAIFPNTTIVEDGMKISIH
jgi:ribonuclease Z